MTFFIFAYWFEEHVQEDKVGPVREREISENLLKLGHKVIMFIPKYRNLHKQASFKVVKIPFWNKGFIRPLSFYLLLFIISFFYAIRFKPDIIYVRMMNNFLPVILSKFLRIPLVIEVHGVPSMHHGKSSFFKLKQFLRELMQRINFRFCDGIITITKELQMILQQRYKVPLEKMTILSSGSNISLFRPLDTKRCRELLKLQQDLYYVGFIGTLYEYQGIHILIDAAPFILNKFSNTKFLIVGEGIMRKLWIKKVMDKGLSNCFIFTRQVPYDKVPLYVNAMDICVAPFLNLKRSVSPVKMFDYFACAKPVVASDVKCVSLFEDAGVTLVPPEDPEQLAEAIVRLLADKRERDSLGNNGRKFVIGNYSWEILTKRTVKVCQEAFKRQKSSLNLK